VLSLNLLAFFVPAFQLFFHKFWGNYDRRVVKKW